MVPITFFISIRQKKLRTCKMLTLDYDLTNFKKGGYKMQKYRVGVLGATGMVGQRFVTLLKNHPWFEVTLVAASARSAGKTYAEATKDRWKIDEPLPESVAKLTVQDALDVEKISNQVDFVFSALNMPKDKIRSLEEDYARHEVPVISNNSAHRWTRDVPMVIPEINPDHLEIIKEQRKRLGTQKGFIAVKPNCSIQTYTPALNAWRQFDPYEVDVSTYQAISGAGKTFRDWPEMQGNIIPFISGEEDKSENEPHKIWGTVNEAADRIEENDDIKIASQCVRVPIQDGHLATVSVKFRQQPSKADLVTALQNFVGLPQKLNLPSAPKHFIQYLSDDNRPQIQEDVNYEHGMGISVGRLRKDTLFDYKFIGLVHNTIRGAAGGGILTAELLAHEGYLPHQN